MCHEFLTHPLLVFSPFRLCFQPFSALLSAFFGFTFQPFSALLSAFFGFVFQPFSALLFSLYRLHSFDFTDCTK